MPLVAGAPAVAAASFGAARQQSAYWLAWVATLSFFAGFYALLVPLPRYLSSVGLPDWQIGLVLGAFGIASLIGRPLAGLATDRFSSRPILLVGAVSLAVGALGVPATSSLGLLFVLRLLQAIGYVAFTTAGTALVVTLIPQEVRAQKLAVFGAAANLAISLTPATIAALLTWTSLESGFVGACLFALAGGGLALWLPTQGTERPARAARLGLPRTLWLPMLATALLGAGFAAFFQFAPILAERRDVPSGLLYTIYGAAIIATRLIAGRVLDRFSVSGIVALAAVLMLLGYLLVATTTAPQPVLVAPALVAASGGLFHPTLIAHHAALLPDTPGRASAAFYVAFDLGIGLGSLLFGVALQVAGVPGLYGSAALLAFAVLPLARSLRPS